MGQNVEKEGDKQTREILQSVARIPHTVRAIRYHQPKNQDAEATNRDNSLYILRDPLSLKFQTKAR